MSDGGPDPTDATWAWMYDSPSTGLPTDSAGGMRMAGAPQPSYDPDEPWVDLAPLLRVSPGAAFDVIQDLRSAGVPVLGRKPRRSGLFSRSVDVTLSVPARLVAEAEAVINRSLGR